MTFRQQVCTGPGISPITSKSKSNKPHSGKLLAVQMLNLDFCTPLSPWLIRQSVNAEALFDLVKSVRVIIDGSTERVYVIGQATEIALHAYKYRGNRIGFLIEKIFAVCTPASPMRSRDIVDPRVFMPIFGEDPSAAVAEAIQELTAAADENVRVRRWKRGLALAAIVALLAGAVVVAVARAYGR